MKFLSWIKLVFNFFKMYLWGLFHMYEVRRVKVSQNGVVSDCPVALIQPPDKEMFAVCKAGSKTSEYFGLYPSIEKANSVCLHLENEDKKVKELEQRVKDLENEDKKVKELEQRVKDLEEKINNQPSNKSKTGM